MKGIKSIYEKSKISHRKFDQVEFANILIPENYIILNSNKRSKLINKG